MRLEPNAYWWIFAVISAYVLGKTGSWAMFVILAVVSVLQLGLTYLALQRTRSGRR